MKNKIYRVAKTIYINQDAPVHISPAGSKKRLGVPFISVLIEITPDSTAEFLMPLDEAIEHGIVEERE